MDQVYQFVTPGLIGILGFFTLRLINKLDDLAHRMEEFSKEVYLVKDKLIGYERLTLKVEDLRAQFIAHTVRVEQIEHDFGKIRANKIFNGGNFNASNRD